MLPRDTVLALRSLVLDGRKLCPVSVITQGPPEPVHTTLLLDAEPAPPP